MHPILEAARTNNVPELQRLLQNKLSIHYADQYGTTALHLAAMYGHLESVTWLIQHGAKVNAKTYYQPHDMPFSPLDLALMYGKSTSVIDALISEKGRAYHMNEYLVDALDNLFEADFLHDESAFDLNFEKLECVLLTHPTPIWLGYEDADVPMSVLLNAYVANNMQDIAHYQRVLGLADVLNVQDDDSVKSYILAKNVLHAFPSDASYSLEIGDLKYVIPAEGYFAHYTLACARDALSAYQTILLQEPDALKLNTFTFVHDQFALAYDFESQMGQYQNSQKIYERYLAGETLLLPTGWTGHAIDLIIDKSSQLMMVANGGERHDRFESGLTAFQLTMELSPDDFYAILNNENKMDLEFKYHYDWALSPYPDYTLNLPSQDFGNCTWHSQLLAEQALLFLSLTKSMEIAPAKQLSQSWFQDFDVFQKNMILSNYLESPHLEVAALADILVNYHHELKTPDEITRAKSIFKHLNAPENRQEFMTYYKKHEKDFSQPLKDLMKDMKQSHHASVMVMSDSLDETSYTDAMIYPVISEILPPLVLQESLWV